MWWILWANLTLGAVAPVEKVELSLKKPLPFSRWQFDESEKPPKSKILQELRLVKKTRSIGNFKLCYETASKLLNRVPVLKPWLLMESAECLTSMKERKGRFKRRSRTLIQQSQEFLNGPYREQFGPVLVNLRQELLGAEVSSADRMVIKSVEETLRLREFMDDQGMARVLRQYGEYLLLKQNIQGAIALFEQSLDYHQQQDLIDKLKKLENLRKSKKAPGPAEQMKTPERLVFLTPEQAELYKNFESAMRAEDYLAAVEDGVKFLKAYPSTVNAQTIAQTLQTVYVNVSARAELQGQAEQILSQLQKVPAVFQEQWGMAFYDASLYRAGIPLFRNALSELAESSQRAKLKYHLARCYQLTGDYSRAEDLLDQIIREATGSEYAVEALFQAAFVSFRSGDVTNGAAKLERLLQTRGGEKHAAAAHYWLWTFLGDVNKERASYHLESLLSRYKLTFYGFIVQSQQLSGKFQLDLAGAESINAESFLIRSDYVHQTRAEKLLAAGWLKEARFELARLPEPRTAEARVLRSRYWAAALDYSKARRLMNRAWIESPRLQNSQTLKLVFPNEFDDEINVHAKIYSLRPQLLRGLIDFLSQYHVHSGDEDAGFGLMKIRQDDAKDIAKKLALRKLEWPGDMFSPILNVRFGSYRLSRMVRRYQGHIGLAIAGYQVGAEKMDRYLKSRNWTSGQLKSDESVRSDIWIEEMPWKEARHAVHQTFRNVMIYRFLQEGPIDLKLPHWSVAAQVVVEADGGAETESE